MVITRQMCFVHVCPPPHTLMELTTLPKIVAIFPLCERCRFANSPQVDKKINVNMYKDKENKAVLLVGKVCLS